MLFAVPIGVGIAIFLTELCPQKLRRPIGIAIELLAGIPSIIYGIWGLFIFAPFLQDHVQPVLIALFGPVPVLSTLFAGPPYGIGMLTAGIILAIMVLPYISSISRDVFDTVPPVLKEAAYGIGCTTSEVVRKVVIPYARVGVIGGIMLALGRALGETMAVTFVIGNAHRISGSLLAPGTTISATIANEFTEAVGDLYTSSLIELGLILFVITFFVLAMARYMLMRIERKGAEDLTLARHVNLQRTATQQRHLGRPLLQRGDLRHRLARPHPLRLAARRCRRPVASPSSRRTRRRPAAAGGLLNAIVGSLIMTVLGAAFGAPIGLLAGTYLAEYGRGTVLASVVRFINDILLSAPSIVIGLFVYEIMVAPMGHFSGIAGAVALALHRHSGRGAHDRRHAAARSRRFARGRHGAWACHARSSSIMSPIARPRPASSPACCSPSRGSAARPRRSSSPRSTISSSTPISTSPCRACRS